VPAQLPLEKSPVACHKTRTAKPPPRMVGTPNGRDRFRYRCEDHPVKSPPPQTAQMLIRSHSVYRRGTEEIRSGVNRAEIIHRDDIRCNGESSHRYIPNEPIPYVRQNVSLWHKPIGPVSAAVSIDGGRATSSPAGRSDVAEAVLELLNDDGLEVHLVSVIVCPGTGRTEPSAHNAHAARRFRPAKAAIS